MASCALDELDVEFSHRDIWWKTLIKMAENKWKEVACESE